jgi:hypothetical protein
MAYTINYTEPQNVDLSDMEEWSINQDKTVTVILKNGKSFTMSILDRWSTYTAANGNTPDSIGGDL